MKNKLLNTLRSAGQRRLGRLVERWRKQAKDPEKVYSAVCWTLPMNLAILKTAISPSEITASIDQDASDKVAIDEIFVVHKNSSAILGLVLNARHNTSNTGEISFVVSLIDSTTKQLG